MKYKISIKKDTGKWWSLGSVEITSDKNPRISIKKSAELQSLIDATGEGEWLKLYLFEDNREKTDKPGF